MKFKPEVDDTAWDDYVISTGKYSFLNSAARLRFLKETSRRFYILDPNDTRIGFISFHFVQNRLGTYLYCQHSPFIQSQYVSEETMQQIISFLREQAKEHSCYFIRLSPLLEPEKQRKQVDAFYNSGYKAPVAPIDALVTYKIDLSQGEDELLSRMGATSRRKVRKLSKSKEYKTEVYRDNSQFDAFAKLHTLTQQIKGYTDKSIEILRKEYREYAKDSMVSTIVGYHQNNPICYWQIVTYGEHAYHYHAATDYQYRIKKTYINYLNFWEAVNLSKSLGLSYLDLFGGAIPLRYSQRGVWKGVNEFKSNLGPNLYEYAHPIDIPIHKIRYLFYYLKQTIRLLQQQQPIRW